MDNYWFKFGRICSEILSYWGLNSPCAFLPKFSAPYSSGHWGLHVLTVAVLNLFGQMNILREVRELLKESDKVLKLVMKSWCILVCFKLCYFRIILCLLWAILKLISQDELVPRLEKNIFTHFLTPVSVYVLFIKHFCCISQFRCRCFQVFFKSCSLRLASKFNTFQLIISQWLMVYESRTLQCQAVLFRNVYCNCWLRCTVVERQSLAGELSLSCTWRAAISDHYCGYTIRYRSANQANSAFYPFRVDKWEVSWNWMCATMYKWSGAIWWKLRR